MFTMSGYDSMTGHVLVAVVAGFISYFNLYFFLIWFRVLKLGVMWKVYLER